MAAKLMGPERSQKVGSLLIDSHWFKKKLILIMQ